MGDSKVSANLHPLLQLRFSTMQTWSKTKNLSGWAWQQASKQASRQPRGYRNCNKTKDVRMRENFGGKPRQLKLEQMHMNVYIFKQVSPSLKGSLQLYALHRPMLLFVDRLSFCCPLSVYSQIDSGCGIKIEAVFVSAKNTLSRPPTHQPRSRKCVNDICPKQTATCTKCKQPKQSVHADRSQEIQQPQTNANKTFSSQRL